MPNEDTTKAYSLSEFLDVVMDRQLDDFANKLRADLLDVVQRDIAIFNLSGPTNGVLLIRAGMEVSRVAGNIAATGAITAGVPTGLQYKELIGACRRTLVGVFKTCMEVEAEFSLKEHLEQSD